MKLLTRLDFDGICCAALLRELGVIGEIVYAHPKDLQDGKVKVARDDVLANVPFVEGCGMWFDHHSSEEERLRIGVKFEGRSEPAPSTARVIFNHYGAPAKLKKFEEMLKYVDKVDSAQLTRDEILNPKGWVLVGLLCDPRTALGYHKDFRVSNQQFLNDMVENFRNHPVEEILDLPDVKERVDRYREESKRFEIFLKTHSHLDGSIVITDTRAAGEMPAGNRFIVYALYPRANISIGLLRGKDKQVTAITVGHSILNRTSRVDVGSLMLSYGGGGHKTVGTCQVPAERADTALKEIISAIKAQG